MVIQRYASHSALSLEGNPICMKATKLKEKTKTLSKLFLIGAVLAATSCDVLESDPDVLDGKTKITGTEVHILADGTSFIDLKSKFQTNVPARVAITSETRHGKLTDLGAGLLQYSPAVGNAARDGFEFTIYSNNNEIVGRDSIIIIIENDSTNLPCSIYPIQDYVYGVDKPVLIDVTENDIICVGSFDVSVYKPESSFPPHHGSAEVQGNKILYSPEDGFDGTDKIIYKITVVNDTSRVAYGIVYISADTTCSFVIGNDSFAIQEYNYDSLILPIYANDSICQLYNRTIITLKSNPIYGYASLVSDGVKYMPRPSATFPIEDNFMYEVCLDGSCKSARVDVKIMSDSISCDLLTRPDSVQIETTDISLHYINVLENDLICGDLKSFTITKMPVYGTVAVVENLITYRSFSQQKKNDSIGYKICNETMCGTAMVSIKRTQ